MEPLGTSDHSTIAFDVFWQIKKGWIVLEMLDQLKTNKAAGPNNIFPKVLKELTEIFLDSLETGEIPDDWKQGNITPIYKGTILI